MAVYENAGNNSQEMITLSDDEYREVDTSERSEEPDDSCPDSYFMDLYSQYMSDKRRRKLEKKTKKGLKPKRGEKKKKKKKKYRRKNWLDDDLPCYLPAAVPPQEDAVSLSLKQTLETSSIVRAGTEIPIEMQLSPSCSGLIFGKSKNPYDKPYVGKSSLKDAHTVIAGGSGAGKTSGIAGPTLESWRGPIFTVDFKGDLTNIGAFRKPKILNFIRGKPNMYLHDSGGDGCARLPG